MRTHRINGDRTVAVEGAIDVDRGYVRGVLASQRHPGEADAKTVGFRCAVGKGPG